MFVQSLMLSMLCTEALDLNASDESLAKSDNVNKGQQQQQEDAEAEAQAETLLNNNADVEQQQQQQQLQPAMVRQVNQMQQTSPEDFVCDEYRYKNKKANTTQTSGTGGLGELEQLQPLVVVLVELALSQQLIEASRGAADVRRQERWPRARSSHNSSSSPRLIRQRLSKNTNRTLVQRRRRETQIKFPTLGSASDDDDHHKLHQQQQ